MALEASSFSLADTLIEKQESSTTGNSMYSTKIVPKASSASVDDDVIILDMFYNNKPEINDISSLSDSSINSEKEDVTFVCEYKNNEQVQTSSKNVQPRRNPVRKARNKRNIYSSDEFDENDFWIVKKTRKKTNKIISNKRTLKDWPLNVYERPEYNPVTKEIEKFDYTIRETSDAYATKCVAKTTKKPKKVKLGRPKRRRKVEFEKKVPLGELKSCVNETTNLLKLFVNSKSEISLDLRKVVQNQLILRSVVNSV